MSCLLTIAIPTLNSNNTLVELLNVLDSQLLNEDSAVIEILISNNSPDNKILKKIVFGYKNIKNFLTYNHNRTILDFDSHLKKMVNLSNGKYIKFISDDDLCDSNLIKNYIFLLSESNASIVVNGIETFVGQTSLETISKPKSLVFSEFFPPFNLKVLDKFNGIYGQLSTLTFKRSLLLDLEINIKTNYIHIFWFFSLIESSKVYLIESPQILIRLGSPNFSNSLLEKLTIPIGGVTAIKLSYLSNDVMMSKIVRDSQDYVFKLLKAVPHLNYADKKKVFRSYLMDFIDRPFKSILVIWYFFVPKFVLVFLGKLLR